MRFLLIALAVALGLWLTLGALLFLFGRRTTARELLAFLPNLAVLLRGLARDPRVPRRSKLLLLFAVAWIASPIDLIPEFIPVLGPLDDVIMAAIVLHWVLKRTGREVVADHWRGDPAALERFFRLFRI